MLGAGKVDRDESVTPGHPMPPVTVPLSLSPLQTYSVFSEGVLEYTGSRRQFLFAAWSRSLSTR